jgi:hypothetical protein
MIHKVISLIFISSLCLTTKSEVVDAGLVDYPANKNHYVFTKGVTAHRGNSADYPENTMPAFKSALSLGVDWIELDIYKTKDGKILVTHDAETGIVSNRNYKISHTRFEELTFK